MQFFFNTFVFTIVLAAVGFKYILNQKKIKLKIK